MYFNREVYVFDGNFENRNAVIGELADRLLAEDVVHISFKKAVLEREQAFPTGLPTQPFGVAIPHTDSIHVKENQIAIGLLKEPVSFQMMGSADQEVAVRLVFLLAMKDADGHLEILQQLIGAFQSEKYVRKLPECKDRRQLNELLQSAGLRNELAKTL